MIQFVSTHIPLFLVLSLIGVFVWVVVRVFKQNRQCDERILTILLMHEKGRTEHYIVRFFSEHHSMSPDLAYCRLDHLGSLGDIAKNMLVITDKDFGFRREYYWYLTTQGRERIHSILAEQARKSARKSPLYE